MIEYYLNPAEPLTPCELFKAAAIDTWERIRFSRNIPNLKIHETTITQNLIYEMRLLKLAGRLRGFYIQEAWNEKTNGSDILLYLSIGGRAIGFALQAKIIYHSSKKKHANGDYRQMAHEVRKTGKYQVDLVLEYAKRERYVPLYLMYNYVDPGFPSVTEMKHFGCSMVSAQFLKDKFGDVSGNLKNDVRFHNLHADPRSSKKPAFPWHELVCSSWAKSESGIISELGLDPATVLGSVAVEELLYDDAFEEITDKLVLTGSQKRKRTISRKTNPDEVPSFNPKFRLIIELEQGRME